MTDKFEITMSRDENDRKKVPPLSLSYFFIETENDTILLETGTTSVFRKRNYTIESSKTIYMSNSIA